MTARPPARPHPALLLICLLTCAPPAPAGAAEVYRRGDASIDVGGRLHADFGAVDDRAGAIDRTDVELRRARLELGADWRRWAGRLQLEFSDLDDKDRPQILNAFVRRDGPVAVTVGQRRSVNSLEAQTSTNDTPLTERAGFINAFDITRQLGVTLDGAMGSDMAGDMGGGVRWQVSAQRAALEDAGDDANTTLAARLFGAWTAPSGRTLVAGLSLRGRDTAGGQRPFRYAQRPFSPVAGRLVDSGRIGARDLLVGAEVAWRKGAWAAQGEAALLAVDLAAPLPGQRDPLFAGGYAQISWSPTGDLPRLDTTRGRLRAPAIARPLNQGGPGAIDLVARADWLDLTDKGVFGGRQLAAQAGVSWRPVAQVRLVANVSRGWVRDGLASGLNDADGRNAFTTVAIRAQATY